MSGTWRDLSQHAVEQRGFARAVGPDHAEDFSGHNFKRHATHGLDGAVGLFDVGNFKNGLLCSGLAHCWAPCCWAAAARAALASRAWRLALIRSGMLSRPSGSQIIKSTTAAPKTNRYQACAKRNHSGRITPTAEPSSGPKK